MKTITVKYVPSRYELNYGYINQFGDHVTRGKQIDPFLIRDELFTVFRPKARQTRAVTATGPFVNPLSDFALNFQRRAAEALTQHAPFLAADELQERLKDK